MSPRAWEAEALSLRAEGLSVRVIAGRVGMARATVGELLKDGRPVCACGSPMSYSARRHGYEMCNACRAAEKRAALDARRALIAEAWNGGATLRDIGEALSVTPEAIGVDLARMRSDGWDVPPRKAGNRKHSNYRPTSAATPEGGTNVA